MHEASVPRLPIVVLTGFLGSGKTTLLNRMIRDWPRSAVLINEFGETPVDHELLETQDLPLMTLSGGCLCCQIRGTLAPVLKNLWVAWNSTDTPRFDRILLETSGVASPEPVLDTLLRDRWLADRYRLETLLATISAASGADQLARFPEAQAQVAWADALVLTHVDLATDSALQHLEARLTDIAPTSRRLHAVHGALDCRGLLEPGAGAYRHVPAKTEVDHGFYSVSLHLPSHFPLARLQEILAGLLSRNPDLVRIKGVCYEPDEDVAYAVHGAAGRLYPLTPLSPRSDSDRQSRLVMIAAGSTDRLATELLEALGVSGSARTGRLH